MGTVRFASPSLRHTLPRHHQRFIRYLGCPPRRRQIRQSCCFGLYTNGASVQREGEHFRPWQDIADDSTGARIQWPVSVLAVEQNITDRRLCETLAFGRNLAFRGNDFPRAVLLARYDGGAGITIAKQPSADLKPLHAGQPAAGRERQWGGSMGQRA